MANGSRIVSFATLIGKGMIAAIKFVAGALTGSSAMLAEGIHSAADTGNQGLMLLGRARAERPPDARFPFGRGKEIYFWAFVVAFALFAVGAGISLYEGIFHLIHPSPLKAPQLNYAILGVALIGESVAWWYAWRTFRLAKGALGALQSVRETKDPSPFLVLFENSAALLGLLAALAGIGLAQATGNPVYDAVATLVIGLILAGVALWLATEAKGLLLGEAAHPGVRAMLRKLARDIPGINSINELVTFHMGPSTLIVTLSLDMQDDLSDQQAKEAMDQLNRSVRAHFPEVKRIFVEVESWSNLQSR